jgi:hypothetical protein
MIVEKVEKVSSRMQDFKQNQTPLDLRLLFSCFTSDVIREYCFANCFERGARKGIAAGVSLVSVFWAHG